ncbi:hypothetical protein SAY87_031313 [Trapa incisa]|uniref:VQ domain-containing protein n=1 Tax=Trapa incisa TaxID=236973 RepID=A0AAN7KWV5_9MYRT|nr:hypothetical protein SAY87_031313 [Trapa incisa]
MDASPSHQEKNTHPRLPPPPLLLWPSANIPSPTTSSSSPAKKPPLHSPRPIIRSEPDCPYPTTFVQADPSTFKQVVQMLTGSSDPTPLPHAKPAAVSHHSILPIKTVTSKRTQPGFRLYERRNNSLKKLSLNPLVPLFLTGQPSPPGFSLRYKLPSVLSPSLLDFPSLTLSPVTPLTPDPFANSPPPAVLDMEAEERAIKGKGFFLHPSPRGSTAAPEPRLLPLFPLTSPVHECRVHVE